MNSSKRTPPPIFIFCLIASLREWKCKQAIFESLKIEYSQKIESIEQKFNSAQHELGMKEQVIIDLKTKS